MQTKDALYRLDPANDEHWTADNQPTVAAVRELTGNPNLTRQEITEADPEFSRQKLADSVERARETREATEAAAAETAAALSPPPPPESEDEPDDQPARFDLDSVPIAQVLSNRALCEQAAAELTLRTQEAVRARDDAVKLIAHLGRIGAIVDARLAAFRKVKGQDDQAERMAVIARSNEVRMARHERTQEALGGLSLKTLTKALSNRSPIDMAMMTRKPQLGANRPGVRPLVRRA